MRFVMLSFVIIAFCFPIIANAKVSCADERAQHEIDWAITRARLMKIVLGSVRTDLFIEAAKAYQMMVRARVEYLQYAARNPCIVVDGISTKPSVQASRKSKTIPSPSKDDWRHRGIVK